jgi:hypothetical protein
MSTQALTTVLRYWSYLNDCFVTQNNTAIINQDGANVNTITVNSNRASVANQKLVSQFTLDEINTPYKLYLTNTLTTATSRVYVNNNLVATITGNTQQSVTFTSVNGLSNTDPNTPTPCTITIEHINSATYTVGASMFIMSISLQQTASLYLDPNDWDVLPGLTPLPGDNSSITSTGVMIQMDARQITGGSIIIPVMNPTTKRNLTYSVSHNAGNIFNTVTNQNVTAGNPLVVTLLALHSSTTPLKVTFNVTIDQLTTTVGMNYMGANILCV